MTGIYVITRKHLWFGAIALLLLAGGFTFYTLRENAKAVGGMPEDERLIHMVTGEFKSTTADGETIEAYRWDPGTVFVEKGERVKLVIYGVNGTSHPFIIEGTDIKGEVKKGEETIVSFQPDKEGVYRIICLTHPDKQTKGPMIGYIVVD